MDTFRKLGATKPHPPQPHNGTPLLPRMIIDQSRRIGVKKLDNYTKFFKNIHYFYH
jgi:hypothetical protein